MKANWFWLLTVLAVASCEKLAFDDAVDLPVVAIGAPEDISPSGVTLTAEVYNVSARPIRDSYFIWYDRETEVFQDNSRYRVPVTVAEDGKVSARIERDIAEGIGYEYRLILVLDDRTVRSAASAFHGLGSERNPFAVRELDYFSHVNATDYVAGFSGELVSSTYLGMRVLDFTTGLFEPTGNTENPELDEAVFSIGPDRMISGGVKRHGVPEIGLWYLDDLGSGYERVGDFPQSGSQIAFSFVTDERCYFAAADWTMASFSLEDYTGVTRHEAIPFDADAFNYQSVQVGNTGYVLFSEFSQNVDDLLHQQEFWRFDANDQSWEQLPPYPGAGKDQFMLFTDRERYIYCGLGTIGRAGGGSDTRVSLNDLWRYDIEDAAWEFVGWVPVPPGEAFQIDNRNPVLIDGKYYLLYTVDGTRLLEIDPDYLSPQ